MRETYRIADTPGSDGNTLSVEDTGLKGDRVIDRGSVDNVKLSDGDINSSTRERLDGRDCASYSTGLQNNLGRFRKQFKGNRTHRKMHLRADTVNELGTTVDLLDNSNDCVNLGIWRIEVVVVDVELGTGINLSGGLESHLNERLEGN